MNEPRAVELSAYSPLWPAVFGIERERLLKVFAPVEVAIEHIGSTAVPGLGAKPIIDMMLGAPSLAAIDARIADLEAEGYRYVPEFEKAMPERRYLVKPDGQPGSFQLHAVVKDTAFWKRHLAFRDALRADPRLAQEYWKLKQRLSARFPNDRAAYTDAKAAFIRAAVEKFTAP